MEQEVRGRTRCIIFAPLDPLVLSEASSRQGFGVEDPARSFSVPVRALCLLRCFSVCSGGRWSEQEVRGRGSMQEDQGLHLKAHPTYRPCTITPLPPFSILLNQTFIKFGSIFSPKTWLEDAIALLKLLKGILQKCPHPPLLSQVT